MRSALKRLTDGVRSIGQRTAAAVATGEGARVTLSEEESRFINLAASGHLHPRALWAREEKLEDVRQADTWGPERTIRAWVIEAVLLGEREAWRLHHRGIRLVGARIQGELDLSFAQLTTPIAMNYCFFDSPIRIRSASIPVFELKGSRVTSFDARRVDVAGEILLRDVHAAGTMELAGARIGGDLDLVGAKLEPHAGDALDADGAHIGGNVYLSDGFRAAGRVGLHGARVNGQINCRNGTFVNPMGDALNANAAEAQVGMFLSQHFRATGRVLLRGVRLGGQLNCRGGSFANPNGVALGVESAEIDRSALLSDGFTAEGEVLLRGVRIGGQLVCTSGEFINHDGAALTADNLSVAGDVLLDGGFAAIGEVRLVGSHIGGQLVCAGTFTGPEGTALRADDMTVDQPWLLSDARFEGGTISVVGASVGALVDDVSGWPAEWRGDGFAYRDFSAGASADKQARLKWLSVQEGDFRPGPYTQLAAVYRRRGDPECARAVLIARERRRTRELSVWRRPFHWLWGKMSAYGYRPWRAVVLLFALIAGSGLAFDQIPVSEWTGLVEPNELVVLHPWLYAADLAVPLVDLRQAGDYQPPQSAQWWMWWTIAFGWFLSLAFVAAVTGIFKPNE